MNRDERWVRERWNRWEMGEVVWLERVGAGRNDFGLERRWWSTRILACVSPTWTSKTHLAHWWQAEITLTDVVRNPWIPLSSWSINPSFNIFASSKKLPNPWPWGVHHHDPSTQSYMSSSQIWKDHWSQHHDLITTGDLWLMTFSGLFDFLGLQRAKEL